MAIQRPGRLRVSRATVRAISTLEYSTAASRPLRPRQIASKGRSARSHRNSGLRKWIMSSQRLKVLTRIVSAKDGSKRRGIFRGEFHGQRPTTLPRWGCDGARARIFRAGRREVDGLLNECFCTGMQRLKVRQEAAPAG